MYPQKGSGDPELWVMYDQDTYHKTAHQWDNLVGEVQVGHEWEVCQWNGHTLPGHTAACPRRNRSSLQQAFRREPVVTWGLPQPAAAAHSGLLPLTPQAPKAPSEVAALGAHPLRGCPDTVEDQRMTKHHPPPYSSLQSSRAGCSGALSGGWALPRVVWEEGTAGAGCS